MVFLCFVFSSTNAPAQTKDLVITLYIHVMDQNTGADLEDVEVLFETDSLPPRKLLTARKGTTQFLADVGRQYVIRFSYPGMVSKFMILDTRDLDLATWKFKQKTSVRIGYDIEMKLFKPQACQDFSYLKGSPWFHLKYMKSEGDIVEVGEAGLEKKTNRERKRTCKEKIGVF